MQEGRLGVHCLNWGIKHIPESLTFCSYFFNESSEGLLSQPCRAENAIGSSI